MIGWLCIAVMYFTNWQLVKLMVKALSNWTENWILAEFRLKHKQEAFHLKRNWKRVIINNYKLNFC